MLKSGSNWSLVPLPASNTKGGERGMLKTLGLDQEEGQLFSYLVLHQNQPQVGQFTFKNTLGVGTSHGQHGFTLLTTAHTRGKPPPPPIQYYLCCFTALASKWLLIPGLPRKNPEIVPNWTPGTLGAHNSRLRTLIGTRFQANLQLSSRAF